MKKMFNYKMLEQIDLPSSPRVRDEVRKDVVQEYLECYENKVRMPEVVLFETKPGHYLVGDGWHRLTALRQLDPKKKQAWPFEVRKGSYADCLRFALTANIHHGLRRTNEDKRQGVILALTQFTGLSDVQLAEICAVSGDLVGRVRKQLVSQGEIPAASTRKGADGKTYRVTNMEPAEPSTPEKPNKTNETEDRPRVVAGVPAKDKPPEALRDKTGYEIPEALKARWAERTQINKWLTTISSIKTHLKQKIDDEDPQYVEITNHVLIDIGKLYQTVQLAVPYAVCPTCSGRNSDKCSFCKGRGFLSEFKYKSPAVTDKIRQMREKLGQK